MLITVVADVARSYVDIRGLQMRLKIALRAVEAAQKNVKFTQSRFERGLTNELDVTLARRELATVQAVLPTLKAAISLAESQLSLLLGTYSPEVITDLKASTGLPHVPSRLMAGRAGGLASQTPRYPSG